MRKLAVPSTGSLTLKLLMWRWAKCRMPLAVPSTGSLTLKQSAVMAAVMTLQSCSTLYRVANSETIVGQYAMSYVWHLAVPSTGSLTLKLAGNLIVCNIHLTCSTLYRVANSETQCNSTAESCVRSPCSTLYRVANSETNSR